jgi:hypothetical protein
MVLGSFGDGGNRNEAEVQFYVETLRPGKITEAQGDN